MCHSGISGAFQKLRPFHFDMLRLCCGLFFFPWFLARLLDIHSLLQMGMALIAFGRSAHVVFHAVLCAFIPSCQSNAQRSLNKSCSLIWLIHNFTRRWQQKRWDGTRRQTHALTIDPLGLLNWGASYIHTGQTQNKENKKRGRGRITAAIHF